MKKTTVPVLARATWDLSMFPGRMSAVCEIVDKANLVSIEGDRYEGKGRGGGGCR